MYDGELSDEPPVDGSGVAADVRVELARLRADLDQVRAHNAALQARLDGDGDGGGDVAGDGAVPEHRSTRRGMLRLAGAAAVGAAAAAAGGVQQAAAANDDPMLAGRFHSATKTTTLSYGTPASVPGATVANQSTPMLRVETNFEDSTGISVTGSFIGIISDGSEAGFLGYNGRYNFVAAASERAALQLRAVNSATLQPKIPPPSRVDFHTRGEIDTDENGDLWWCFDNGSPGKWRKIAGGTAAGSLHPITPTRVYDSRAAAPSPGVISGGASRVVSVSDARPDFTGAVATAGVVPAGASAIAYNLTVADTVGAGFLSVNEGDATGFTASSINWSATGQLLANGLVVKLDGSRQVKVFAGGGGSTNFLIDVLGYYL